MIVADTNLIAYLLIPGERTPLAERVQQRDGDWIAPPLWRHEFRNVLVVSLRAGLFSVARALEIAADAETLMDHREFPVDFASVIKLAVQSRCSAYDCEFVSLAQQRDVNLVTADRQLLAAFPGTAVSLETFAA